MNQVTQDLLIKVNNKLKEKPLIYFCKDGERATGLEDYLNNYHIACFDNNYLIQMLSKKISVYCEQAFNPNSKVLSTLELLNSERLVNWVNNITGTNEFYAQFFQFNNPSAVKVRNLKGQVLNNDVNLNRKFEDKLSQYQFLLLNNIPTPKTIVANISDNSYFDFSDDIGAEFVVQLDRAHTGLGTFFVRTESDFENVQRQLAGNTVRVSKLIKGTPYTINACITNKGVYISGLQYQITGISDLAHGEGSTVGNDFSYANELDSETKNKIYNLTKNIGELMKQNGYKGLFGIDFILEENINPLLIEINARQTANIPLQTKLELKSNITPLALINLCVFLGIDIPEDPPIEILPLQGAQVFLRSKKDGFIVNHSLKSGIYRLQSDNAAIDWKSLQLKEGVILIDEEGDKPLVWQKDGYSIADIENNTGGFVLLINNKGSIKNKAEELARMQFNNKIIYPTGISPWILEAFNSIENIIQ